jgi:prepilin-type N-terminal cleavage/methylation domain-containing protein
MGRKNTRAFTLIELIIVVSIIATVSVVAIAYFRGQIFKGNDAKRKADINRIKIVVEEYEKDHNCYPLAVSCNPGTNLRPYIDQVPCDPTTHASYFYEHQDAVCPHWYRVYTKLENVSDSASTPNIGPSSVFNFSQASPNAPEISSEDSGPGTSPTPPSGFYGCKSNVCVPISWNASRPGPECDPNFQNSTCYNQCGLSGLECIPWH